MAGVVCKAAGMAGTTGRYTSIASEASRSKGAISASAGGRGPAQMSGRAGEEWVGMAKPPHGKRIRRRSAWMRLRGGSMRGDRRNDWGWVSLRLSDP